MPQPRRLFALGLAVLALLAVGISVSTTAPHWSISGTVIDDAGRPIPGARVRLPTGEQASSDASGAFSLQAQTPGTWVQASAPGYLPRTRAARTGDDTWIRLSPDDGRTLRLVFGGDVMFGRRFYDTNDDGEHTDGLLSTGASVGEHRRLLAGVEPMLSDADVTVVNLETPLISDPWFDPTEPRPDRFHPTKEFAFASAPEAASALAEAGVDVVALGNNHVFDALDVGLESTRKTLDNAGFGGGGYTGFGRTPEEAWEPAIHVARGQRIAVVACTTITGEEHPLPYVATATNGGAAHCDADTLTAAVADASARSDVVIAMIHGGFEYVSAPSERIVALSELAHAAGAHLVINHHPHVVGGLEFTPGGQLTAWTLGNLLFDQTVWPTFASYLLRVDLRDGRVVGAYLEPIILDRFRPVGVVGERADWVARGALALSEGPWVVEDGALVLDPNHRPATMIATERPDEPGSILNLDGACDAQRALGDRGRDLLWTGDFEDLTADEEDVGGALWTGDGPQRRLLHDAASAGSTGVRMARTAGDADDIVLSPDHRVLVTPGQPLTAMLDVRGTHGPEAVLQLSWYNDTRGASQAQTIIDLDPGESWHTVRADVVVPANAVAVGYLVRLAPPASARATLDVDNALLIGWGHRGPGPGCDYGRLSVGSADASHVELVDLTSPYDAEDPRPRWIVARTIDAAVPDGIPPGPSDSPWQGME